MMRRLSLASSSSSSSTAEVISFGRKTTIEQYDKLLRDFTQSCTRQGLALTSKVNKEFEKRKNAINASKCKLDLKGCSLTDGHVKVLLGLLEASPILLKLDLRSNNITSAGLNYILTCLQKQLTFVMGTDIDDRLETTLLSNIEVDKDASSHVSVELENAKHVLSHCNAMMFIRQAYLARLGQGEITRGAFTEVWLKCLACRPSDFLLSQQFTHSSIITYSELEMLIITELEHKSSLPGIPSDTRY